MPTAKRQPTPATLIPIVKRSTKTASALAIVEGEDIKDALEDAVTTVEPVEIVDKTQMQKSEGATQTKILVNKSVRSAELKDLKELKISRISRPPLPSEREEFKLAAAIAEYLFAPEAMTVL